MFLLKKIISPFLFPVPLCLEILLLGLFLLWFTRKQKIGRMVVSMGVVLLVILSYGLFSNILLESFEYKYHPW